MIVLRGLNDNKLVEYLLSIIVNDPCAHVSHYVTRAMLAWLGPAMKEKADVFQNRYVEEFAEEEGRAPLEEDRWKMGKTAESEEIANLENLRKQFENNTELQQDLWNLLK